MKDQRPPHPLRPASSKFVAAVRTAPNAHNSAGSPQPDLRQSMVLIVHPADAHGDALARAVSRVGCRAEMVWPVPASPPVGFDFALVELDNGVLSAAAWLSGLPPLPIVGVIDGEKEVHAEVLRLSNVQAILSKPCKPAAVRANLILARHAFNYERRLQSKITKLEETLYAARQIEQAKLILMRRRKLGASEAYEYLRRQAMNKQMTVAAISAALVDASGLID
jgi:AmiR/NasT family two-component response regulator